MNCSISDELPEEPVVSTTSGYLFEKRLIEQHISSVTKEGLQQQGYVVVPSERRFVLLYSFVKKNLSKKIMVIFSSCNSVEFHSELLRSLHVPCTDIHGKQQQEKRRSTFFEFCKAEKGILLCTGVADIPAVDWIVQYEPPADPKEYIQRVGSTGAKGNALLFLIPQELQFLTYLKNENVAVKEYEFDQKKLANVQTKLVEKNFHLNKSSKEAYRCFILAYNSHPMKDVFNVHRLDLQAVAASFCFSCPPKVNLNTDSKNSFNDSNLYGRKRARLC